MKCYSHRISHPNINSRWVVVLNVKVLLEDSMWKYLSDLKWWKGIFKTKVKAIIIKKNIYKLDYIKIKKFCLSKDIINGVKSQARMWQKTFQYICLCMSGCISRIYKELLQISKKKKKKWQDYKIGKNGQGIWEGTS